MIINFSFFNIKLNKIGKLVLVLSVSFKNKFNN